MQKSSHPSLVRGIPAAAASAGVGTGVKIIGDDIGRNIGPCVSLAGGVEEQGILGAWSTNAGAAGVA